MENQPIYNIPTQDPLSPAGGPLSQSFMPGTKLPGPVAILGQAWEVYKTRFWLLIAIYSVPAAAFLIYFALAAGGIVAGSLFTNRFGGGVVVAGLILAVLIYIAIIYIGFWSQVALLFAVKGAEQKIGFKESFILASHKIGSFFGAGLLAGLAIVGLLILFEVPAYIFLFKLLLQKLVLMGGSIWASFAAFGLLTLVFAIPAIIVGVRYALATFVVVGDDACALPAVKRSADYVKGFWWAVFGRLLFITVVAGIFSLALVLFSSLIGKFFENTIPGAAGLIVSGVFNIVVSIILPPLYTIYVYKIYENLKFIKGESQIPAGKAGGKGKVLIILAAVIGVIILIGLLLVLPALNSARAKSRDARRFADIRQLDSALELYRNDYDSYPAELAELIPTYISNIPKAPEPADGTCSGLQNAYLYRLIEAESFQLTFCFGDSIGGYSAGVHSLTEYGIDKEADSTGSGANSDSFFQFQNQDLASPATNPNYFTFSNINLPPAVVGAYYDGSIDFSPCNSNIGLITEQFLPPGLSRGGPATLAAVTGNPSDPTDICRIFIIGTPTQTGKFALRITLDAYGPNAKVQDFDLQVNGK